MGNGPNRATQIPAKFKPSHDVRLLAELRVAVLSCKRAVGLGARLKVRRIFRLTTCTFSASASLPIGSAAGREEFLHTHGSVVCYVLGPPGDVATEGTWAWNLSPPPVAQSSSAGCYGGISPPQGIITLYG